MIRSNKITKSARSKFCTLEIPGVCNHNPETTVFCHLETGIYDSGVGMKGHDLFGAYGCSSCHDYIDRRTLYLGQRISNEEYNEAALRGMARTIIQLVNEKIVEIH